MQIRLFTISIFDEGAALEEMNRFMRGHRVLAVKQELVNSNDGSFWCFSISYLLGVKAVTRGEQKNKIDYREVLDEKTFSVFNQLREIRKEISSKEGIPVYAVFTNAELAEIASLKELMPKELLVTKGIGAAKLAKYGQLILELYHKK